MKTLLSFALIAGFALVANANNHKAAKAPVAQDCSQIKDLKQKAECEASLGNKPAATVPAPKQTK